jgi:putative glutamine amidotransferase
MRPAIGICAAVERARWGPWDAEVALMPLTYAGAVQAAGGLALVLPPDPAAVEEPAALLARLDALVLAGGADVDPTTYGAGAEAETDRPWPERDRFELALTREAIDREIPVLGVCRGMQLLNVARGGTLIQHLPRLTGDDRHRHTPGLFSDHEVRLEPGSLAAGAAGAERLAVKSHHHQALERLGEGLVASGWSVPDDVVEAVELPGHPFALGVLWHPEEDTRSRVIGALVEAAHGAQREVEEAAK